DCDIVNDKFGDFFSFIPLVPAHAYLDRVWAVERLDQFIADACKIVIEEIHRIEKKRDAEVRPLEQEDLLSWFQDRGAVAVLHSLGNKKGQLHNRLTEQFKLVCLATASEDSELPNLGRLKSCWHAKGKSTQEQAAEIKSGLSAISKSLSTFVIPELPE